jgi:uncharacterized protein (TIGR03382 family)
MLPSFRATCCILAALTSTRAWACSLVSPEPLFGRPDPSDTLAPLAADVLEVTLQRGAGPAKPGAARTSCDDLGWIALRVQQPESDPHPIDEVGYLLELERGALPPGLVLPEVPWLGPTLVLPWLDVGATRIAPLDLTLRVTAVDPAANRAPAVYVDVRAPAGGCGCSGAPPTLAPWLLVALLARRRSAR